MEPTSSESAGLLEGITGESRPRSGRTYQYAFCPTVFPYIWHWRVSGDAQLGREWTSSNCYFCEIKFNRQAATITFEQSNPPGVPQVSNVTKYVQVQAKLRSANTKEFSKTYPKKPRSGGWLPTTAVALAAAGGAYALYKLLQSKARAHTYPARPASK